MAGRFRGILFDKDGTLFDFHATWGPWAAGMLIELAQGDPGRAAALGRRIGFDLAARRFAPDSVAIAGTPEDAARLLLPGLPGTTLGALIDRLNAAAATAPMAEAVPLAPLLDRLRAAGLALGVATNDGEAPARAHLERAGVQGAFDFVAGFDSGFGAKPGPGMCLGFARATGLAPERLLMVGDSTHDLHAARAAGLAAVAVLTGPAREDALAPLAEAVLPDIGHLPRWLGL